MAISTFKIPFDKWSIFFCSLSLIFSELSGVTSLNLLRKAQEPRFPRYLRSNSDHSSWANVKLTQIHKNKAYQHMPASLANLIDHDFYRLKCVCYNCVLAVCVCVYEYVNLTIADGRWFRQTQTRYLWKFRLGAIVNNPFAFLCVFIYISIGLFNIIENLWWIRAI